MSTTPDMKQQIAAIYREAEKRLVTGKLKNTAHNTNTIIAHVVKNGWAITADNFYAAFQENLRTLDWEIKPAKLLAIEANERPATVTSQIKSDSVFTAKVRAGEAADEKAKANAKWIEKAYDAVSKYMPRDRRTQTIAYGKKGEEQARLCAYIKREEARNAIPKTIFSQVEKEIARLYREEELASERI